MTSKHHKWQLRWQVDASAGLATHDSGLRVRFADHSPGQPENADAVAAQLAAKHGLHNTPQMIERLLREADQLVRGAHHAPR